MIRNDKQFKTIRARVARLRDLDRELENRAAAHPDDARLQLEHATVRGEIDRMTAEINEYEDLKAGRVTVANLQSLDDLPRVLIQSRIAAGLSQRELAQKLEMKEQQVQRYEATNYESASLTRLLEIARALEVDQLGELNTSMASSETILSRLDAQGFEKELVLQRIAPAGLRAGRTDPAVTASLIKRLARVFGWASDRLDLHVPELNPRAAGVAAFKSRANASEPRLTAYASYAHFMAKLALEGSRQLHQHPVPTSPSRMRALIEECGGFSFRSGLLASWSLGIPVLPLADPGAFQAAYWRHQGRGVIVLKQRHRKDALWFFDLLHELWHAGETPERSEREVIDLAPTDPARRESIVENAANTFAAEVLFGRDPSKLFDLVWTKADGQAGLLKRTVQMVARKENVDVGALAYYTAHRLGESGIDWWGTATNLQPPTEDPWAVCRELFLTKFRINSLTRLDQDLLLQGLTESVDSLGAYEAVGDRREDG